MIKFSIERTCRRYSHNFVFAMVASLLVFSSAIAKANDGFGAIGVGGIALEKTDNVAMQREVLDISYSEIRVSYEFVNESDHDVESTVSFPLPLYSGYPPDSEKARGQPGGFKVTVDNVPVRFVTEVRAINNGVDVTDRLKSIGFSEKQLAEMPFSIFARERDPALRNSRYKNIITSAQISSLRHEGLYDEDGTPTWSIQVVYHWLQKFPSHSVVHISHRYKPFVSGGTGGAYYADIAGHPNPTRFCFEPSFKKRLDELYSIKENRGVNGELSGTIVEYVLKTANTWKDGIRDFTLRIHKGAPDELVSLCFPGKFKKIDALTLESHLFMYKPEADLSIYFAKSKYAYSSDINLGVAPTIAK